jgi:hypothetical protein
MQTVAIQKTPKGRRVLHITGSKGETGREGIHLDNELDLIKYLRGKDVPRSKIAQALDSSQLADCGTTRLVLIALQKPRPFKSFRRRGPLGGITRVSRECLSVLKMGQGLTRFSTPAR